MTCSDCVPALNRDGSYSKKGGHANRQMYKALEEREGPRPFQKAVCRHLCKNDSTAPNGFVCTLHTTWGTTSENCQDKSPETRAKSARIAGKHRSPNGGKIGANKPDHPNKVQVTCPHCGKVGAKMVMARWHFDRCKFNTSLSGRNLPRDS